MQKRSKKVYSTAERMNHDGFKLSSFRDSQGLSQKEVAEGMGMTQQNLSLLEQQFEIEDEVFAKVAKELGIETEALRRYEPKTGAYYNIQAMNDSSFINNINPLAELLKAHEENKQLFREKEALILRIIDKLEAENAQLAPLKARIVEQDKQIKALQDLLGNKGNNN